MKNNYYTPTSTVSIKSDNAMRNKFKFNRIKKNVFFGTLLAFGIMLTLQSAGQGVVRWTGASSTAWSTAGNWTTVSGTPSLPPGANDDVEIGIVTYTTQPTLSGSGASVKSITFGTASTVPTLTVTGVTLTVSGAVTLSSLPGANTSAIVNGSGTLNCASVAIGTTVIPSGNFTTTLTIGINTLNISGNLNINSFYNSPYKNDAKFIQGNGAANYVYINGSVVTNNANAANTSTLQVTAGGYNIYFRGATTFNLSATGTNTITFGSGCYVNYDASGNQTIYGGTYETYLILGGSGVKTVTGQALANTNGSYYLQINSGVTLDLNGINNNTTGYITGSGIIDNLNPSATGTYTLNIKTGNHGTFSGLIKNTYGTVAFNKQGVYTQTLSGLNTYSGGTTISNGIIALGISSSSATMGPLGAASGGINVLSGASLFMNGFSLTGAAGQALSLNGSGYPGAYAALSNYNVAALSTYSGLITLTGNTTIFGDINITNPGTITGSGYSLTLRSVNIFGSSIASVIGTGTGTVTLSTDAGQIWTFSGANTYTGLTTISAGTLKLGSAGSGGNTPLGTTAGATTVASGATLDLNGYTLSTSEGLTIAGVGVSSLGALMNSSSNSATYSGNITVTTSANIGVTGTGDMTLSGVISSGTTSLTKVGTGSGSLILSGSNSYTGQTIISAGTVSINTLASVSGGNSSLGAPTTAGNGTINIGATGILKYTGAGHSSNRVINLTASGGAIDASGSGALTLSGGITGNTFGLVLTGTGAGIESGIINTTTGTLTKNGQGTWTLSALNTYTGTTTVNSGSLVAGVANSGGANGAFGNASAVTLTGGNLSTGAAAGYTQKSGALTVSGNSILALYNTGSHSITFASAGTFSKILTITGWQGTQGSSGTAGQVIFTANPSGVLGQIRFLIGSNYYTATSLGSGPYEVVPTSTPYAAAFISVATGNWDAPATWGYSGTPSAGVNYPGGSDNATISSGTTVSLTGTTSTTGSLTISGILALNGNNLTAGSFSGAGNIDNSVAGTYTITTGGDNITPLTFSGVISNSGGTVNLIKNGTGTLTLSGLNTYTGTTTINQGTLAAGSTQAFGINSALTLANVASTGITITGFNNTIGSITGGGATGGTVTLGAATLTIGGDGTSPAAYAGVISGTGAITKTGAGTLILSGISTFSGLTTINAGTLKLGANGTSPNGPLGTTGAGTTVANGAVLDLNGYSLATAEALTINGTGISSSGALTNSSASAASYSGLITLGSTSSIVVSAGDINITNAGTITGSGFGLTLEGNGSGTGTMGSIIGTGAGTLTKNGTCTWILTKVNTYTAPTIINAGTLTLGIANAINSASNLMLNGGIFRTGASTTGYAESIGTLAFTDNSAITLATGNAHTLAFSGAGTFTGGKTLTIYGWQGSYNSTTATAGKITVGGTSLTAGQLAQILFYRSSDAQYYTATQISAGEVVPTSTVYSVTPLITLVNSITAFGNQTVNTISSEQSYTVSGSGLTADIIITPPAGFEISKTSGSGFVANPSSITLTQSGGSVTNTTIYVRFKPTAVTGYSGNITNTSTGATQKDVAVSGTGISPANPNSFTATVAGPTQINLSATANGNSNNIVVVYNGTGTFASPTDGIAPGGNGASLAGGTIWYQGAAASLTNHTGLSPSTAYYYKAFSYDALNFYSSGATANATTLTPTITVGSVTAFGNQTVNTISSEKSYTVSGTNLITDIIITPPAGFEISTGTGGSFVATNPITLTQTGGTVNSTTIYVRFTPTAVTGYSGNITHTSTGATQKDVAVSGTGISPANPNTFTASAASSTQINLTATANGNGNTIVVVFNGTGTFTTPTDGIAPGGAGASLAGGTIWYQGTAASLTNHTGLSPLETVYYKAFSYDALNFYSSGATANATTNSSLPTININSSISGFGNQIVNTISSEQSYTVSGSNLTTDIVITPPAGFEISLTSGSGFVANPSSITLTQTGGSVASTTVYVRFKPTAVTGYSDNITHTSTGATTQNVAVSGTGISPANPNTFTATAGGPTQINLSATANGNSNNIVVVYNGTGTFTTPTDGIAPGGNGTSLAGGTIWYQGAAASLTNHTGLSPTQTVYYKAFSYDALNFYSSGAPANATTLTPTITVGSVTAFGNQTVNTISSEKSYTVSGTNLVADIVITPPSGFEISTGTGGGFVATNPITLTQTGGTVNSTTIYVRFTPTAVTGYSGNITHTSTDATQKDVAVSGTGISPANPNTFTATAASSTQINLTATANANGNTIVVVFNGTGTFTTPTDGMSPGGAGASLAGGTIWYQGTAASLTNHTGLSPSQAVYYKAFSYDALYFYSSGATANASTYALCIPGSTTIINDTTTETYSSSGICTWTCPSGVTQITVECWGAGGGGKSGLINYGTGGGGGGAYVRGTATVTPGTTYDLYVGAGGTGGAPGNGAATNGEWSWFKSSTTLAAKGGLYGSNGGGGQGGASYYCVSPFSFQVYNRGGDGYIYSSQSNGGGGGSSGGKAGSGINPQPGNSATSSAGASAPAGGGPGGNGGTVGSQTGSAPVSEPGGGGGGAYKGNANAGGNGANGQVKISWEQSTTYYWVGGTNNLVDQTSPNPCWATSLGGTPVTTPSISEANIFIFDGSDISSDPGFQTGAVAAHLYADPISMGQLILQNNAVVTIIADQASSTLKVGRTGSTSSLSGDDILINSGCSLTVGTRANLYLIHTSAAVPNRNSLNNAGTLTINSGRSFYLSSAWKHTNSGTIDVYGSFITGCQESNTIMCKLDNSGTFRLQNGSTLSNLRTNNNLVNTGNAVFQIVDNPALVSASLIISYTQNAKLLYTGTASRNAGAEWPVVGIGTNNIANAASLFPNSLNSGSLTASTSSVTATHSNAYYIERQHSVGNILLDGSSNTLGTIASIVSGGTSLDFTQNSQNNNSGSYYTYQAPFNVEINKTGSSTVTLLQSPTLNNALGEYRLKGTLTLTNGNINLGNQNLTIESSGSISAGSASSFVNTDGTGRLIQAVSTSKTFPVGNGSDYMPVIFTAATSLDYKVGIKSPSTALPAENILTKVWDISAVSGSPTTIAPQFTWNSTVDNGVDAADKLYRYSGGIWAEQAGTFSSRPAQYQANYSGVSCCGELSPYKGVACANPTGGTVTGSSSVCSGATAVTYTYSGGSPAADAWSWSVPAGASITSGAGTASITVTWGSTSGDVSCTPSSGACAGSAVTRSVTVNAFPSAPSAGNNGPVCEDSTLSLTASTISGATYSWTGPNGFTSGSQNPTVSTSATTAMSGTYSVTATVAGCTGSAGTTTATVTICNFNYTVKLFLQGYYLGGSKMSPLLHLLGATSTTVVDTVTIELHRATSPYDSLFAYRDTISSNGNMVCTFPAALSGNSYYIVVKHRNSVETWSATAQTVSAANSPYDFTAANAAYGTNTLSLGGGKYGIYSGDVTNGTTIGVQDGSVTTADKKAIQETLPSFRIGVYDVRDITGDGFVDEDDYRIMQNNISLTISVKRPQ